jgi:predicted nucleotidyltransferase
MDLDLIPGDFARLLDELNRAHLPYVLVGGIAVNLLGRERATNDVDVLVPATKEQGDAIRELLARLGATRVDGSPLADHLFDGEHHIRALTSFGIIDFIPEGEAALSWESISADAFTDELHGVSVPRVSLAHLVALKRLAGRPQDREDLRQLERAYYGPLPDALSDGEWDTSG